MSTDLSSARIYTDFQGLASLRHAARRDDPAALREVAGQFEAIFLQMMLKSMREAQLGEGIFDNESVRMYQDMHDRQLANHFSASGGLGIAEMLVRQLAQQPDEAAPAAPASRTGAASAVTRPAAMPGPVSAATELPGDEAAFASPADFVRRLWPHAERTARELGVPPETLIAQAGLETGWGRHVVTGAEGRSSYNLFNIKADSRWSGSSMAKTTVEFRDGVAVQERARFRAYGSYAESFADYAAFLTTQPRYADALAAGDAAGFVRGLAQAGYATDPEYPDKILDILGRPALRDVVAELKSAGMSPIA